jgi:hypothetical protein
MKSRLKWFGPIADVSTFLVVILLVLLVFVICVFVVYQVNPELLKSRLRKEIALQSKNPEEKLQYIVAETVTPLLSSPSTARFAFDSSVIKTGRNQWFVTGSVDTQNRYGATVRTIYNVELLAKDKCANYYSTSCWTVTRGPNFSN